jgi:hypothetical protein
MRMKAIKTIKTIKLRKVFVKKKTIKIEIESKGNNNSNEIKESEIIYI